MTAADTPSLSFFAVGTCQTIRDTNIPGLDPVLYCPAAHQLRLTLHDGNGADQPTPTYPRGSLAPALTIESPTVLRYTVQWTRPRGVIRSDLINVALQTAGLLPSQQPLRDFSQAFNTSIDPAIVQGAAAPGGVVIRIKASAAYTTDAFYPCCLCLRPASWTFDTEITVRVIYRGTQPVITQQPQNQSVTEGQTASFAVAATGNNLSYQWLSSRNGVETLLSPAPSNTPTTGRVATLADSGLQFFARVCSTTGAQAAICVNSNAASLTVFAQTSPPVFTTQPQTIAVLEGQGSDTPQDHDAGARGVHASLPAACTARRLPSHPASRVAGQSRTQDQPGAGAGVVACAAGARPARRQREGHGRDPYRRTTGLHLPTLRPRNDHPADLLAGRIDPRPTGSRVYAMTTHLLLFHYRPTIASTRSSQVGAGLIV